MALEKISDPNPQEAEGKDIDEIKLIETAKFDPKEVRDLVNTLNSRGIELQKLYLSYIFEKDQNEKERLKQEFNKIKEQNDNLIKELEQKSKDFIKDAENIIKHLQVYEIWFKKDKSNNTYAILYSKIYNDIFNRLEDLDNAYKILEKESITDYAKEKFREIRMKLKEIVDELYKIKDETEKMYDLAYLIKTTLGINKAEGHILSNLANKRRLI